MKSLRWNTDDIIEFDIDEELVDQKVFNDENAPLRLWDRSHEIKNVNKKLHNMSE